MSIWGWLLLFTGIGVLWRVSHTSKSLVAADNLIAKLPGPGTYSVDIVGESKYQDALERICGGKTLDGVEEYVEASLILENSNKYDNNAVRIDIDGQTVGYLSRETALQYRQGLKKAGHPDLAKAVCGARIRGGWDRGRGDTGHFGVKIDLPTH